MGSCGYVDVHRMAVYMLKIRSICGYSDGNGDNQQVGGSVRLAENTVREAGSAAGMVFVVSTENFAVPQDDDDGSNQAAAPQDEEIIAQEHALNNLDDDYTPYNSISYDG